MSMRPRTLLILFVLVAGLSAFIWFFERELPSTDERREAEKKILDVDPDSVREIFLEIGDRSVHLSRQGLSVAAEGGDEESEESALLDNREWRIVEPIEARADEQAVASLLDSLKGLERERPLVDFDAEAVGLAEPRGRVRVVSADGEETLLVGSDVPASTSLIVQREGSSEAAVTRRGVWTEIDKPAGDWRSKRIFTGGPSNVVSVSIERPEGRLELERRAGDFWIVTPVEDRAREQRVNTFVGSLTALQAQRFVDGPVSAAELGLEPAAAVLVVRSRGDRPSERLEIGTAVDSAGETTEGGAAAAQKRYARFEGQVVEIGDSLDEALAWKPSDWQADRWSSLDVWQIDHASVRSEGVETVLSRAGGDWKRGDETIGYDSVSDFLYAIDEVASESLAPRDEAAWGTPVLEIDLSGSDREEHLAIYPAVEGMHPATVDDRGFALLLDSSTFGGLLEKLEAVRTAEPKAAEPEEPAADG